MMAIDALRVPRARLLGVVALLAALFAMHGFSSDHMALRPTPVHAHTSAATAMSMSASMSASGSAPRSATETLSGPGSHPPAARVAAATAPVMPAMSHAECLAALRDPAGSAAPSLVTTVTPVTSTATLHPAGRASVPARAPPRPDLSTLCISRT